MIHGFPKENCVYISTNHCTFYAYIVECNFYILSTNQSNTPKFFQKLSLHKIV